MDIMALAGGSGLDLMRMKKMMRKGTKEEGMLTAEDAAPAELPFSAVQVENLMVRNGVNGSQDDTKNYAKKSLEGMQAASVQQSRQDAILNAGLNQVGGSTSYAVKNLAGNKAARAMMQDMQRTVQEEAEQILEENKKDIEAAAEQAMQPSDATVSMPGIEGQAISVPPASAVSGNGAAEAVEPIDIIV